jgi:DNA-binding NtrC family response regulator
MKRILIVDDNLKIAESLESVLRISGYKCFFASTSNEMLNSVKENEPDVILLDIMLGKEDGISCLRAIKEKDPSIPVIMITGYATIENAVLSMKLGAFDFIQKPLNFEHLRKIIENALQLRKLQKENNHLNARLSELGPRPLFNSPMMSELFNKARQIASTDLPVLIKGETGTGKELLAEYIHAESNRRGYQLNKINCAAFPESLLDNELFGHERGAYTGAVNTFKGIFEQSHKGTLFLDEIGDMPISIQAKILRVLQNGEIRRIGGTETIHIDVRFIAATNKDPETLIKEGTFRQDLLFRLNVTTFTMPPLRERIEDIPILAEYFMKEFRTGTKWAESRFSLKALDALMSYQWPGNVRELKNAIMYACAIGKDQEIQLSDLPAEIVSQKKTVTLNKSLQTNSIINQSIVSPLLQNTNKYGFDPRSEAEADIIRTVLMQCNYNKKKCAEILKMSRNTLYRKIAQYGISDKEGELK